MIKFRRKRDYIEACQFTGTRESFLEMQEWLGSDRFYYNYQEQPTVFSI